MEESLPMKPALRALTLSLIALLLATACERSPQSGRTGTDADGGSRLALAVDPAEVRAAVDHVNTAYVSALLAGNPKQLSECFTEHGAILLPNGRVIQGRDSIFTAARPLFLTHRVFDAMMSTSELFVIDENAFEIGRWTGSVGGADAASGRPDSGQYVRIWKRDDEREWKIWRDIVRSGPAREGRVAGASAGGGVGAGEGAGNP
jgi:ketosteroid isomerase-like protein